MRIRENKRKRNKTKKGFEFSFAWIFAMLIGAVIIFLAVYASIKAINLGKFGEETAAAKELTVYFQPFETKTATALKSSIVLAQETKISNFCEKEGDFGKQKFSFSIQSGFFKKWKGTGKNISESNKYIFSQKEEIGKKFYIFTMPFKMPFKVANLVIFSSKKYCFINAPEYIKNGLESLGLENVKMQNSISLCSPEEERVCFSGSCDIEVSGDESYGIIIKEGKEIKYSGNLLYAGIFSEPEIYKCNVERLLKRQKKLVSTYIKQAGFLSSKCGSVPVSSLLGFSNILSSDFNQNFISEAEKLNEQNEGAECPLW